MQRLFRLIACIAALLACAPPALAGEEPAPAAISIGAGVAQGTVTADRGADVEGQPVDISRPAQAGGGSGRRIGRATMTSGFGMRVHPILGGVRFHQGIDLAAPSGTPVFAASEGVVSAAAWTRGYGLLVTMQHANGLQTRYGHLSRVAVRPGQRIHRGDLIGFVGSTGLSTGPHLHYEVRQGGAAVNPLPRRRQ